MKRIRINMKGLVKVCFTLVLTFLFITPSLSSAQKQDSVQEVLNEALWHSFLEADTSGMRELVGQGANINDEDPDGFNLLFWAQEQYADQIVIDLMIDLGAIDRNKEVAGFMSACESGNLDSVKLLLNQGTDINATRVWVYPVEEDAGCDCFETGVSAAIRSGNIDLVRFMIENGAEINFNQNGVQPLYIALAYKDYAITDLLLENGADKRMTYAIDDSYYAHAYNDTVHLNYLIENNFPYDQDWDNALIHASSTGDSISMRKLFHLVNSEEIDVSLCFVNEVSIAKILVAEGASANSYYEDNTGCGGCAYSTSALNSAISSNNIEIVKYLIQEDADIDFESEYVSDSDGYWDCFLVSPLTEAAYSGNIEIAKLLIDLGADVNYTYINVEMREEASPLIYAIQDDNLEMVSFLIEQGATIINNDLNAIDYIDDNTSIEIIELFKENL